MNRIITSSLERGSAALSAGARARQMHPLRLSHDMLLRQYAPSRQSQAEMVALEGLNLQI